jgi:hypothetical protein
MFAALPTEDELSLESRDKRQFVGWPGALPVGPCFTSKGVLGRCTSFRQCYPYFKLPELSNWETWILGMYDTCSYFTSSGRQVSARDIEQRCGITHYPCLRRQHVFCVNSMQNPSSESDSRSVGQEISRLLWNYRVHINLPLVSLSGERQVRSTHISSRWIVILSSYERLALPRDVESWVLTTKILYETPMFITVFTKASHWYPYLEPDKSSPRPPTLLHWGQS